MSDDTYSPQSDGSGGAQHPKKVYMRKHLRSNMRPDSDGNSIGEPPLHLPHTSLHSRCTRPHRARLSTSYIVCCVLCESTSRCDSPCCGCARVSVDVDLSIVFNMFAPRTPISVTRTEQAITTRDCGANVRGGGWNFRVLIVSL